MKTSLRLMMGLAMSVGAAGLAQAAPACSHPTNAGSRALVAASTTGSGWLADLNQLLSGQQTKHDESASGGNHADASGHPGPHLRQPGPVQTPSRNTSRHAARDNGERGHSADPVTIHAGGDPLPASDDPDTPPTLGWQSLLPGSIQ